MRFLKRKIGQRQLLWQLGRVVQDVQVVYVILVVKVVQVIYMVRSGWLTTNGRIENGEWEKGDPGGPSGTRGPCIPGDSGGSGGQCGLGHQKGVIRVLRWSGRSA